VYIQRPGELCSKQSDAISIVTLVAPHLNPIYINAVMRFTKRASMIRGIILHRGLSFRYVSPLARMVLWRMKMDLESLGLST